MGWHEHHAIVVTTWDRLVCESLHASVPTPLKATSIVRVTNGFCSFCVVPDGSKEGWEESDAGDAARDLFVKTINSHADEDGSTCVSWVEVSFPGDGAEAEVVRVVRHAATERPEEVKKMSEPCNCERALVLTEALEMLRSSAADAGLHTRDPLSDINLSMDNARAVLAKYERNYSFTITIKASGDSPEDAWTQAVSGFINEPGPMPEPEK